MGGGGESSILSLSTVANSQGSHAWPADSSLVFALAQTLRASALEGPRSVIANSFLQFSHVDCAALFRPQWDCFSPLKKTKNPNTTLSLGKRVTAALPCSSEHVIYRVFPQLLLKNTPTLPPPPHKHGCWGTWEEGSHVPLPPRKSLGWRTARAEQWVRLLRRRERETTEEEDEVTVKAGMTIQYCNFCFLERWPATRSATWWGWGPAAGCSASCRACWAWTKPCCGLWNRVPSAFGSCSTSWVSNSSSATGWETDPLALPRARGIAGSRAAHPKPQHSMHCSSMLNADALSARC